MKIDQKRIAVNFTKGRAGYKPRCIVLHIMAGTYIGTDAWFHNPAAKASTHYGVSKKGEVCQWVSEYDTAWHCGTVIRPTWKGINPRVNPNFETIGIEHEGKPTDVWTQEMKIASSQLIAAIAKHWKIPLTRDNIIGHYQISAGRRDNCPAVDKSIIDELISLAKQI